MQLFPPTATVVRYKMSPQLKVFTAVFALFVAGTSLLLLISSRWDAKFFIAAMFLCVLLVLIHVQQIGYRIGWDKTSLYMRRWGILNGLNIRRQITRIDWSEVASLNSTVREVFGRNGDFLPDEVIKVATRKRNGPTIPLYPAGMNPDDFEELVVFMRDDRKLPI